MSSGGSVTHWIRGLKAGEETALEMLFARYWPRLVSLARSRLRHAPRRAADEEDVAQRAFWEFCQVVKAGRTPRLESRESLWALLALITARKAASQLERELRQRRGAGKVRGESAVAAPASSAERAIERLSDSSPTAEEEVMLKDLYDHYVGCLEEPYREIAELHLAGLSHREIAERKGIAKRTSERKFRMSLDRWQAMARAELRDENP
jgi:RNA polymerase sigma factor (sigma-70 family)